MNRSCIQLYMPLLSLSVKNIIRLKNPIKFKIVEIYFACIKFREFDHTGYFACIYFREFGKNSRNSQKKILPPLKFCVCVPFLTLFVSLSLSLTLSLSLSSTIKKSCTR